MSRFRVGDVTAEPRMEDLLALRHLLRVDHAVVARFRQIASLVGEDFAVADGDNATGAGGSAMPETTGHWRKPLSNKSAERRT